jgi:O-antigen/teichoic acid export membrane protein
VGRDPVGAPAPPRESATTFAPRRGDRDVLVTVAASLALQAMVVVTGVISARLLGAQGRGELALVLLWPTFLAAVGELGLQVATARFASRDVHLASRLFGLALVGSIVISVALVVAGAAIVKVTLPASLHHHAILFLILATPLSIVRLPALGLLRGLGAFAGYNACRLLLVVPYFILLIGFFALDHRSVWAVALANLAGVVVSAFVALGLLIRRVRPTLPTRSLTRDVLRYGAVVHIGTIASSETLRLDLTMVALVVAPHDLGIYTAASSIMFLPRLIGQSIGIVALTEKTSSDAESPSKLAAYRFRQTALLTGAVVLGLVALSDTIMDVAFGPEFGSAGLTASILTVGGGIVSIRRVLADCLRRANEHLSSTIAEVLGFLLSLVLLYPAVAGWGLIGAAASFTIAHLASFALLLVLAQRKLDLAWRDLLPGWRDSVDMAQSMLPTRARL